MINIILLIIYYKMLGFRRMDNDGIRPKWRFKRKTGRQKIMPTDGKCSSALQPRQYVCDPSQVKIDELNLKTM